MKPFQAILCKESRQQGALALAMVLFCLLIQMSAFILSLFPEVSTGPPEYFAIAVLVTALFTGAAAAISFSGEQDERTFGFLRSLPVSTVSIFLGKTAWLVIGTLAVFAGTSLLAGLWTVLAPESRNHFASFSFGDAMATFGVGILEAFVWGLFWSPRCRSQVHALLATYFCASTTGYFCAIFGAISGRGGNSFAEIYANAIPFRLGVLAVVAVFAVWGGLRWFDFWVQGRSKVSLFGSLAKIVFGRLSFPKRIQSPLFALLHQGFRQSQLFLLVGFVSGLVTLYFSFGMAMDAGYNDYYFFTRLFAAFSIVYFIVLCGSIFGADQKNDTYRFLGRCGARPGTVWWSRILPTLLIVFPLLLAMFVWFVDMEFSSLRHGRVNGFTRTQAFSIVLSSKAAWLYGISTVGALWLVPFSCGAMISICVKRTIVAVALTGAAAGAMFFWMGMGLGLFSLSPLWTTLPLCLALLVASRLQAENWIRERTDWRCYVKSLAPFFVTGVVILAAVPVARIYSIPFIPLAEVRTVLDSAQIAEQLPKAERDALFHKVSENLDKPLPAGEPIRPLISDSYYDFEMFYKNFTMSAERHDDPVLFWRQLRAEISKREHELKTQPTFEEWLLLNYEINHRAFFTKLDTTRELKDGERNIAMYRFFPWERTRMLRRINTHLVMAIEDTGLMPVGYSSPDGVRPERRLFNQRRAVALFDDYPWPWRYLTLAYYNTVSRQRLYLVHHALHLWHLEHDETLPESLDELVAEDYLKKIPTDPRTGEPMHYIRDYNATEIEKNKGQVLYGPKPGWPSVEFGRIGVNEIRVDLRFLPGYDEYGVKPF